MIRFADWPERLDAFIAEAQTRVFEYGRWDCGHFVCDAAIAITGVDPGKEWRARYNGPVSAARRLIERGFDGPADWADHVIGQRIGLAYARRGDWVLAHETGQAAFGICLGRDAAFLRPSGLTYRRTLSCPIAWPIGD